MAKTYELRAEQFLPISAQEAWSFFSAAENLAQITPPDMDFKILTDHDGTEIYEGMLIDYTVKPLFGIPVFWQTEISKLQKPAFFTDRQLRGPYKLWEHTHTFTPKPGGVLMEDVVRYQLPLGILGTIAHSLIVKRRLNQIFSYRKKILNKLFNKHGNLN